MTKKKLNILIGAIIIFALSIFILFNNKKSTVAETNMDKIENSKVENNNKEKKDLTFFKEIAGVKAVNVELIDNPVGIKGEFLVPEKSILNGINYFLKETNNEKISNVNVNIDKNSITARVDYKVNKTITTPIEVKFVPTVNKEKDLVLNVKEVKLLDLKLPNWVVDIVLKSFIKDWFSKDSNIEVSFKDGNVTIDKSNFKGFSLSDVSLDSNNLKIKMIIDLNYIINKK